ncbi:MAG: hypothetical protein ACHQYP_12750 [Nitrospiria bacterium]
MRESGPTESLQVFHPQSSVFAEKSDVRREYISMRLHQNPKLTQVQLHQCQHYNEDKKEYLIFLDQLNVRIHVNF